MPPWRPGAANRPARKPARRPGTPASSPAVARRSSGRTSPGRGAASSGSRISRRAARAPHPRAHPPRSACPRRRPAATAGGPSRSPAHSLTRPERSSARPSVGRRSGWWGRRRWLPTGPASLEPAEQLGHRQAIAGQDGVACEDTVGGNLLGPLPGPENVDRLPNRVDQPPQRAAIVRGEDELLPTLSDRLLRGDDLDVDIRWSKRRVQDLTVFVGLDVLVEQEDDIGDDRSPGERTAQLGKRLAGFPGLGEGVHMVNKPLLEPAMLLLRRHLRLDPP